MCRRGREAPFYISPFFFKFATCTRCGVPADAALAPSPPLYTPWSIAQWHRVAQRPAGARQPPHRRPWTSWLAAVDERLRCIIIIERRAELYGVVDGDPVGRFSASAACARHLARQGRYGEARPPAAASAATAHARRGARRRLLAHADNDPSGPQPPTPPAAGCLFMPPAVANAAEVNLLPLRQHSNNIFLQQLQLLLPGPVFLTQPHCQLLCSMFGTPDPHFPFREIDASDF